MPTCCQVRVRSIGQHQVEAAIAMIVQTSHKPRPGTAVHDLVIGLQIHVRVPPSSACWLHNWQSSGAVLSIAESTWDRRMRWATPTAGPPWITPPPRLPGIRRWALPLCWAPLRQAHKLFKGSEMGLVPAARGSPRSTYGHLCTPGKEKDGLIFMTADHGRRWLAATERAHKVHVPHLRPHPPPKWPGHSCRPPTCIALRVLDSQSRPSYKPSPCVEMAPWTCHFRPRSSGRPMASQVSAGVSAPGWRWGEVGG